MVGGGGMNFTTPKPMQIRNTSLRKETQQLNSVRKIYIFSWEQGIAPGTGLLLKGSVAVWKVRASSRASRGVGGCPGLSPLEPGRNWDFPLGKWPHPEGWWVLAGPCPYACCQAYLCAHLLKIALWGPLWDKLVVSGATVSLG